MTLEQAIRAHWAATSALNDLLPVTRLVTGRTRTLASPYATLLRSGTRNVGHTSAGRIDAITLRLELWHDDYAAGRTVMTAIDTAFRTATLTLSDGQQCLSLRVSGQSDHAPEEGPWQFVLEWTARVLVGGGG